MAKKLGHFVRLSASVKCLTDSAEILHRDSLDMGNGQKVTL